MAAQPSPAVAAQEAAPAAGGGAGIGLLAAAATAIGAGLPVKPRLGGRLGNTTVITGNPDRILFYPKAPHGVACDSS